MRIFNIDLLILNHHRDVPDYYLTGALSRRQRGRSGSGHWTLNINREKPPAPGLTDTQAEFEQRRCHRISITSATGVITMRRACLFLVKAQETKSQWCFSRIAVNDVRRLTAF